MTGIVEAPAFIDAPLEGVAEGGDVADIEDAEEPAPELELEGGGEAGAFAAFSLKAAAVCVLDGLTARTAP
jgi:hypothetical protein